MLKRKPNETSDDRVWNILDTKYVFYRQFHLLLHKEGLYNISAAEDAVPVEFLGVLCDGSHQPHVRAILYMCNAHLLVSFGMGSHGSVQ